jgi:hypothetical protein
MATETVHYCEFISPEFLTSLAKCGRFVPNEQAYEDDGPEVSCKGCLAAMKREDAQELARRVRRHG